MGACRAAWSGERWSSLSALAMGSSPFTSEARQALTQLANSTKSPQPTSFSHLCTAPAFCLALLQVIVPKTFPAIAPSCAFSFHLRDAHNYLFGVPLPTTCLDAWSRLSHCPLPLFQCPCSFGARAFPMELRVLSLSPCPCATPSPPTPREAGLLSLAPAPCLKLPIVF